MTLPVIEAAELIERYIEGIDNVAVVRGELVATTSTAMLPSVLEELRDNSNLLLTCIIDICCVDWPEREKRFEVVYHLLSVETNLRVRLKTSVSEHDTVPTAVDVFPGALWFEREAYDLYGVIFEGHGDLRRLLTDYNFEGYPLRKDFPLTGFVEVRYDEAEKRVVSEPVSLTQEFRSFDYESPWQNKHEIEQILSERVISDNTSEENGD